MTASLLVGCRDSDNTKTSSDDKTTETKGETVVASRKIKIFQNSWNLLYYK